MPQSLSMRIFLAHYFILVFSLVLSVFGAVVLFCSLFATSGQRFGMYWSFGLMFIMFGIRIGFEELTLHYVPAADRDPLKREFRWINVGLGLTILCVIVSVLDL